MTTTDFLTGPAPTNDGETEFQAELAEIQNGVAAEKRKTRRFLAVVLAAGLFGAGGYGAFTHFKSAGTHTITGTMLLTDSKMYDEKDACNPTGGYSDLGDGAQVTVKDGAGKVLAVGSLETGTGSTKLVDYDSYMSTYAGYCSHNFTISTVPDAAFYNVEIGHRGGLNYSKAEMSEKSWTVGLSIGN